MDQLTAHNSITPNCDENWHQGTFSTDFLFGNSRGKMFGIMECLTREGSVIQCKAFSGQYNGLWLVQGWAPPLFDVDKWTQINSITERKIKELGEEIQTCPDPSEKRSRLVRRRKTLSQALMKDLHALYRLTNFSGRTGLLSDVLPQGAGIPTGMGDCCAPKLLNFAAKNELLPIGITEFYWGRKNLSGTRQHRNFYLPCTEKCGPLLGFLLCGLKELYAQQKL